MNSIEAAHSIWKDENMPILYLTGNPQLLDDKEMALTQPFEVIAKPSSDQVLMYVIESLSRKCNVNLLNVYLK